jgi:tetratricopeptide (TPR) repeat protein
MSEPFSHKALLVKKISREIKLENTANKEGNLVEAIKHGQKVRDYLLHLMKIMEVDSHYELEKADATEYDLLYWAATFADGLYSASLQNKSFEKQQLNYFESYVDMHYGMLDRYVRNLGNIRILLAECYFKMGKTEKTDSLFKDWLNAEPDWGAGWIGWSDLYWLWDLGVEKDFKKAEKILSQGLKVPNVNDRNAMEKRLKDLKLEKHMNL